MGRFKLFCFSAVLLALFAGTAQAADVKATGYWWIEGVNRTNWNFNAGTDNHFSIEQKMRTAFTFTANENLRAVLDTQIGTENWGKGLYGIGAGRTPSTTATGANSAGNGNIMLRRAFIEYKLPNTLVNLSVGFQTVTLPAAFGGGSAIMDDQVASAVVTAPIMDHLSIMAGYARPTDTNSFGSTSSTSKSGTSTDAVFAALPISYPQFSVVPFGMFLYSGANSVSATTGGTSMTGLSSANSTATDGLRAYWAGTALTVTPKDLPIKVMADFNYGKATYTNYTNATKNGGRAGWMADLAVDYTGLSMMTPEAFFVYSSGETGKNPDRSNRMPVISAPQNWAIGSFFFGERLELAGSMNNTAGYTVNTLGYWATGISLKDISLVDKLSHTVNLLYARGTNSKDYLQSTTLGGIRYAAFLTEKDSLWEVDLNSRYKIYDELTAYLYLGYINASFDKDIWGASSVSNAGDIRSAHNSNNAYKIGVGLNYFF